MNSKLPFVVFALFLALWTWKLLEPSPVPEVLRAEMSANVMFVFSKIAHGGAYAFLTVLTAWLPIRRLYFWMAVATLALHGGLTEYLQYAMNVGRTGAVTDVLIDWAGIGLGLAFLRLVTPRPSSATPSPPA